MSWYHPKRLSENGKNLLRKLEGCKANAYKDVAGHRTIGVGHKLNPQEVKTGIIIIKGKAYSWNNGLSETQINELLDQDNNYFEVVINHHVRVPLVQSSFDAILIFTFNVGATAFLKSTLLKKVNSGNFEQVPDELRKWIYVTDPKTKKKIISKGLQNRRNAEIKLWERAS